MEAYVRHLFIWGPQIQVTVKDPIPAPLPGFVEMNVVAAAGGASQEEKFYVTNDGQKIIRGALFNINENPFGADAARLKTEAAPGLGPENAPVSVVVFSDFQCGFCKEEAKMLRENVAASYPKDVRVVFKDFPLEAIHPWAKPAAIAGRCIFRQNAALFWDYHDWIFGRQAETTVENLRQSLGDFVKTKGIEPLQFAACMDIKATEAEVDRSIAEGRSLQINSTPTIFVNGRKLVGQVLFPQLQQIINHELGYQKTQAAKREECCEVKLPSPLNKQ